MTNTTRKRTGPTTEWGKMRSGLNAIKVRTDEHGNPLTPRDRLAQFLKSRTATELETLTELGQLYEITKPSLTHTFEKTLRQEPLDKEDRATITLFKDLLVDIHKLKYGETKNVITATAKDLQEKMFPEIKNPNDPDTPNN